MRNSILTAFILIFIAACQSGNNSQPVNTAPGVHTAVVQEVLQTTQYTYLRVKEGEVEQWLALAKMQAAQGETYYYRDGLVMTDFESKELKRNFKNIIFLSSISTSPEIAASTEPGPEQTTENTTATGPIPENVAVPVPGNTHNIVAEEVLQTSQYTYIRAKENGKEEWIAVAKMDARAGTTYYFEGGLQMTNFVSKELNKTFKEILFVDNISTSPSEIGTNNSSGVQNSDVVSKGSAIDIEKKDIKISHSKDDVTIAKLLENKNSFTGKTIKIKGQVSKISLGILKKNWIHLQDGTDFSGKYDLTITTSQEAKVGDKITAEGKIALDKDFGYGYFYEVIMEDAVISK